MNFDCGCACCVSFHSIIIIIILSAQRQLVDVAVNDICMASNRVGQFEKHVQLQRRRIN